ncbi:MAG: archease [Bacteroidota bacterium]
MAETTTYLPHVADVRIEVHSDTLPGLFKLSLDSMNQLLKPNHGSISQIPDLVETIELTAPDTSSLLIDFLSEVLTMSYINKTLFYDLFFYRLTDSHLSADVTGVRIDGFEEDIKAVTYHEADVHLNDQDEWQTTLVFDV